MSFLSIAFLAALPLAAAPILLHLFDRRRNVTIEWGAMQFLLEAATRRTSARRLKQWLLLLMRACAVAALVLALARPRLPGNWLGGTDHGETVFVLDNSMSMSRSSGEGTLFDEAVDRAIETLDGLEQGDSVRLLLSSPYPVWGLTGGLRLDADTRTIIEEHLRELRPTAGRSDLLAALFTAVQAELEPPQHRRRIVLLTDGQVSDWRLDDEAGWSTFREVLQSATVPTELEIVELNGNASGNSNVAVDRIHSSRTVVGVDQPFSMTAQLQNHGSTSSGASPIRWRIDGIETEAGHAPPLESGQSHDAVWKHSFSQPGVYSISCHVDTQDELAADNSATIVIEVVEKVPVIVVEGAEDLAEIQQDAFFVLAALGWTDAAPLDVRGVHVPTLVQPERLAQIDLSQQRAVVIPNLTRLDAPAVTALREYVEDGGGLWISLGPRTDVDNFNQYLYAEGNGLSPVAIDQIVAEESRPTASDGTVIRTGIDPFLDDHPATRELADNEQLDLVDVSVSRRFRFVRSEDEDPTSVLLRLTSSEPLAVEKYVGRGRVIVQSIPLRLQWSSLARSQSFVVMVHDWMNYLTEPGATRHNLSPGEPIALHVAESDYEDATLSTPHGDEVELTGESMPGGVLFRTTRTALPGDYSLELGLSGDRIPFHVNRDVSESELTPLANDQHVFLADVAGLQQTALSGDLAGGNEYEPVWPFLLACLVGLIAAELLLSGVIARERYGSVPISGTGARWTGHSQSHSMSVESSEGSQRRPKANSAEPLQAVEV